MVLQGNQATKMLWRVPQLALHQAPVSHCVRRAVVLNINLILKLAVVNSPSVNATPPANRKRKATEEPQISPRRKQFPPNTVGTVPTGVVITPPAPQPISGGLTINSSPLRPKLEPVVPTLHSAHQNRPASAAALRQTGPSSVGTTVENSQPLNQPPQAVPFPPGMSTPGVPPRPASTSSIQAGVSSGTQSNITANNPMHGVAPHPFIGASQAYNINSVSGFSGMSGPGVSNTSAPVATGTISDAPALAQFEKFLSSTPMAQRNMILRMRQILGRCCDFLL